MAGALTDAVAEFWRYLRVLTVDTVRMFVRLFPQLVALQLLGWLGYGAALRIGASISYEHPWIALVVFSTGFVFVLGAIVLQLRLVGAELGIRRLLPDDAPADDRDEGISRLLALTLLPFLGIYAAFGFVQERAQELMVSSLVQTGVLSGKTLASQLAPQTAQQVGIVLAVVAGAYVIRRILDLVHDATGWRVLGLLAAFVEAFFMLSLLLSGGHLLTYLKDWFFDRALSQWIDTWVDGLAAVLAVVEINLPAIIKVVGAFLGERVFPFLLDVIGQPLAWLAVAALIYGSHVLSLADLWRKGTRTADAARELARRKSTGPRRAGSATQRRAWLEFQEVFLGDIDDKYVPTFQSLRLVLHAGVLFLAAFAFLHLAITRMSDVFSSLMTRAMGGHTVDFWYTWDVLIDLSRDLPFEPLRVCLLAVALRECLLFFRSRAEAANAQRYAGVAPVDSGARPARVAES
ncbi:hypothetical protein [Granulicoccus sp. GXG6511]|uniref:hypothetical protein n=1 Tax=Granulicoccus sp. GXG6511 TaxID=3381351 RepID=UPI003D7E0B9C